jgi:hypothetical protein
MGEKEDLMYQSELISFIHLLPFEGVKVGRVRWPRVPGSHAGCYGS